MVNAPVVATITGPAPMAAALAERILRALPQWFGVEPALLAYAADAQVLPNLVAMADGIPVGFVNLRQHNAVTLEINCIAVVPAHHGQGIGTALVNAAADWWSGRGGKLLQVKTIGPSRLDLNYARTRAFYVARGFLPVEEFMQVWPGYPCLLLVLPVRGRADAS